MSNENVVCVNELVIRFEQMENENAVNWSVIPDERVLGAKDYSLLDLAELGAPLSLMGIHQLCNLFAGGLLEASLDTANSIKNGVAERLALSPAECVSETDAKAAAVLH